jgi:hypothetical protein
MPSSSHQRTSASSRPCVTQTSSAPSPGSVAAEFVPVAMVGDDQRQFHAALLGALADAHPARREGRDGIGKAPRPAVGEGRGRADHDRAGKAFLGRRGRRSPVQRAEIDALFALVEVAELRQRAVDVDRLVVARLAQQPDHALRLAERIGADHVGALGELRTEASSARPRPRRRVAEDRQAEGRLGDEDVAGDRLEGQAGGVGLALVVARDDDRVPRARRDLRRAEHMAGRMEGDRRRRRSDPSRRASPPVSRRRNPRRSAAP